jgi:rifampicin phosphotransferase
MLKWLILITCLVAPFSANAAPAWRARLQSEAQFAEMARTIDAGRHPSFPQLLFVIDRAKAGEPKLYFINSRRYQFHTDFVQKTYLSTQSMEKIQDINYIKPERRFIMGSVVRYPKLDRYGIEFWEGDQLTVPILATTMNLVQKAFPKPLAFKPNSELHFQIAAKLPSLSIIDGNQLYDSLDALILNAGEAVGRLRILRKITSDVNLAPSDIVILDEAPLQMSPVAGIITTEFSTPLAHVNLLAKSWRVPNGFLRNASQTYRSLENMMVVMTARKDVITLRAATAAESARALQAQKQKKIHISQANLSFLGFPTLEEQTRRDSVRTGAKAANLGDVAAKIAKDSKADFSVPAGFSIPFYYYAEFIKHPLLKNKIDQLLASPILQNDQSKRRAALASLRAAFLEVPLEDKFSQTIAQRRKIILGEASVFARSSTNSEDLKGFNGAGLYTSVPNVISQEQLDIAIRTVWASVWNDTAFEARSAAGIDHHSVMASVLIQRGINADAAGVMITENPFDNSEKETVYINAKRGLGMRVVEGRKIAEQLLYRAQPESIQILTHSTDDAMLTFDEKGGVREIAVAPGHSVLTDALARRLARIGKKITRNFGGRAQDIEWVTLGDTIYIVQSRPYLRGN